MNNNNQVNLLGFYGSDMTHCLSAWQSTNLELGIELDNDISKRIEQLYNVTVANKKKSSKELLSILASSGHETPFEKSCLHFQIKGDIASHIHIIKHRIATSINSESARYKELTDKWYIPEDWKDIPINLSEINDDYVDDFIRVYSNSNTFTWDGVLDTYTELGHKLYHLSCKQLSKPLGRKRAKESARYFLPYNKQLDFDCMFNFRSFIHFLKLRNSQHAQKEIQDISQQMLNLVRDIPDSPFNYSLEAFGY
jgi:thymidylate synthase (FAD)